MAEIEDMKKLPPEERIKRLRELAEKDKKEIEEAQKLIKESELEAEDERERKLQIPIAQLKATDMTGLVSEEEKQMFKTKRYVTEQKQVLVEEEAPAVTLEEKVEKEKPQLTEEQLHAQKDYIRKLTADKIEDRAEYLRQVTEQGYDLNPGQEQEVYNMMNEAKNRQRDIARGVYKGDAEAANMLDNAENILKKLYNR